MEGINGNKAYGLPHTLVIDLLKKCKKDKIETCTRILTVISQRYGKIKSGACALFAFRPNVAMMCVDDTTA